MSTDDAETDSVKQITPRCLKLLATMLQNMFPSLNVHNVKLKQVRNNHTCQPRYRKPRDCSVYFSGI